MLKLVKWAYKLGVRNERHRIAAYLTTAQNHRFDEIRSLDSKRPFDSKKDYQKRTQAKNEFKKAVDNEVINIISGLFESEQRYERGTSVMFPEEEEL